MTIFLVLLAGLFMRANIIHKHRFPGGDEGSWVRMAAAFPSTRFLQSNVVEHDLYQQRILPHPEDNRSPMFPILMALVGLATSDLFLAGQLISLTSYLLLALIVCFSVKRVFGRIASFISILLISFSPFLVEFSTQVYPDLLMALGFYTILLIAPTSMISKKHAFFSGLILGLFFLVKSTAIFLIPMFGFYIWKMRNESNVGSHLFYFVLPFLACALPWILRNTIVFSSPLYQFTNYALYVDNIHDLFKVGITTPSFQSYLEKHNEFFILIKRPFFGFLNVLKKMPYFDSQLSLYALPLCIIAIKYLKNHSKAYVPPVLLSIFLLPPMFSFAYVGWVNRYLMIYYIWLYILAGIGVKVIFDWLGGKTKAVGVTFCITVFLMLPTIYPAEFYLSKRGNERERELFAKSIISDTRDIVPDSCAVLSSFLSGFYSMHNLKTVNTMNFESWEKMNLLLTHYNVRFALLDEKRGNKIISLFEDGNEATLHKIKTSGPFSLYKIE
jgi:hypothetical protein